VKTDSEKEPGVLGRLRLVTAFGFLKEKEENQITFI
jgi:hypothetical protein